jgi:hypothetical protein
VLAGADRGMPTDSPLCNISRENVTKTVDRILDLLSEAAELSDNVLGPDVEENVREMVDVSLKIALQFGVQSAQLQLCSPEPGDHVKMGTDFHDCEDGDLKKGFEYEVDLVVAPGLQKIGDGRSNKASKRTIVPCEIYPQIPVS